MKIKVLGSGCKNCQSLEKNVIEALKEIGKEAKVEKVTDMKEILGFGVMKTPALVIDEKVVVSGRVATVKELIEIL
ncbi:MAG: TM0996/MTH895 family glutaredoxin-like protein [Sebaldella sp.]|nr:TM0996/MTH895 family glutaredoxin-like protein [Sebaldella sp.]